MQNKPTRTPKALMRLALGAALLGLAGCYPPSALEMDYGNSVRNNMAQQVVNPQAGFNPKPAVGLSPRPRPTPRKSTTRASRAKRRSPWK